MINGSAEESYSRLPSLLYMIQQYNPGTVVNILKEQDKFKYLFFAMGACIEGWNHCRPVVVTDATFLKTCYRGQLISSCAYDAAGKIFPLGFAVVDKEDNESWEWFFRRFREAFGERPNMVVVSDRHPSIERGSKIVFPNAPHCVCSYHLLQNLKTNFRKDIAKMSKYFKRAVKAYTIRQFDRNIRNLRGVQRGIVEYLEDVGYAKWSRAHSIRNRYVAMTSNIAESMNAMTKHGKHLPITSLVDFLRVTIQKIFYKNRNIGLYTFTGIFKKYEKKLRRQYHMASKMEVEPSDNLLVSVMNNGLEYVVDLEKRTCTCNRFQMDEIPCAHALALIRNKRLTSYDYCSAYYKKEAMLATYGGTIHPIPSNDDWLIPQEIMNEVVLPPNIVKKAGRPKKQRYKSALENETTYSVKCGLCKKHGHNVRTCKGKKIQ